MDGELVAEEMAVPEGLTPADWRAIRKNLPARPKALSDSAPQRALLKASNADPGDRFGRSVAVWHNTVFVGAPREASDPALGENDNSLYEAGAVYVFERSGSGWAQTAMLKASNAEDNGNLRFGISLAVEQDTLVVGADMESSDASGQPWESQWSGAAYVFERESSGWVQKTMLKANNAASYDYFGASVGISGSSIIVGAPSKTIAGKDWAGAAYVFTRSGSAWIQRAYLQASNADADDRFGASVAISGDYAVVGAPGESGNRAGGQSNNSAPGAGAAYVFLRTGSSWAQQAYLKASDALNYSTFGDAVAIDGDYLAVGAPGAWIDLGGGASISGHGAAYVFQRTASSWIQQARLQPGQHVARRAGSAVVLSGEYLVVGAPGGGTFATAGAAQLYRRSGSTWTEALTLRPSNPDTGDDFGTSVALSGETVIVGAVGESSSATGGPSDNSANDAGAAYVFAPGYRVRGNIAGLTSSGLKLLNNGGDLLTVPASASNFIFASWTYTFDPYNVTIAAQPTGRLCNVSNGVGIVNGADIFQVGVQCVAARTVSTSVSGSGTISPTSAVVPDGGTATFNLSPATNWKIGSVSGCNGTLTGAAYKTGPVSSNCTVTAQFVLNTYTLTYNAGANGSISGTSPQTVNHGSSGSPVTAVANADYHFVKWSDGSTANPRTDSGVSGPITVSASFAINSYTLSYSAGANGSISGTSPQTVNHGSSGSPVTAVADTSYHFVNWSDGSTANPRTDSGVTGPITVNASFALNSYTLIYNAGANGSISGTSPQTVDHGSSGSPVTAVPGTGYHFVQWSDGSTAITRTDTNVTAPVTVTASFAIDTYTLTYSAGANGSISGVSPQTVAHGSDGSAVTALASAGYRFVKWSDDSTANPRTDADVTADISVVASFGLAPHRMVIVAGDGQAEKRGEVFPVPLTVRVLNEDNVPVPSVDVSFLSLGSPYDAGATFSNDVVTTDANGEAQVTATANLRMGTYEVNATVAELSGQQVLFALENLARDVQLEIMINNGVSELRYGQTVDYLIEMTNLGRDDATGVLVGVLPSAAFDSASSSWVCLTPGVMGCIDGTGVLVNLDLTLPSGDMVSYLLTTTVSQDAADDTASVRAAGGDDYGNVADEDVDSLYLFKDGFEGVDD